MALPAVTSSMRQSLADREEQTRADLAWLAFRHRALRQYTGKAQWLRKVLGQCSDAQADAWRREWLPLPEDIVANPKDYWSKRTLQRFNKTFKPSAAKLPSQNFNHYVNQVVVVFAVAVLETFLEDAYETRTAGASLKTPRDCSRSLNTYIEIIDGDDPENLRDPPPGTTHLIVDGFKAGATDVWSLCKKRHDIVHAQTKKDVDVAIDVTARQLEHSIEFVSDTVQKFLSQARAR